MGLDCSHDAWHGAYSAFSRWRDRLAEAAGYTFHKVPAYEFPGATFVAGRTMVDLDWGSIEATIGNDLLGRWPAIPVRPNGAPDPLIVLLAHSDCEGEIQVNLLLPLAARLEELVPMIEGEDGKGHIGDYGTKTRVFIDGLRLAAAHGEPLGFH